MTQEWGRFTEVDGAISRTVAQLGILFSKVFTQGPLVHS